MKIGRMKHASGGNKVHNPGSKGGKVVGMRPNGTPIYASQVKDKAGPKAANGDPIYASQVKSSSAHQAAPAVRTRNMERAEQHREFARQAMRRGNYEEAHMHVNAAHANGLPVHARDALRIVIDDHKQRSLVDKETAAAEARAAARNAEGAGAGLLRKMHQTEDQKWDAYQSAANKARAQNAARLEKRWKR